MKMQRKEERQWETQPFAVTLRSGTEGRAQSDAESGASVMVQRLDSPDMFMAQVLQPGIVTVKE